VNLSDGLAYSYRREDLENESLWVDRLNLKSWGRIH
jgi:hypothetical protein